MPETCDAGTSATDTEACADAILRCREGEDGSGEAFTELYEHYQPLLVDFVLNKFRDLQLVDAEDVVQETFLLAQRNITKFRGEAKFSSWLCKIARNVVINNSRGKARGQVNLPEENKYFLKGNEPTGEDEVIRAETVSRVREAIHMLSPKWGAVVQDIEIDGMKYEECAEHLHIPVGTVRSTLSRAKALLKNQLQPLVHQAS